MQIDDIVNKIFTRSFMGYDMREVDSFLDDIIDKLERYESERREMLTAMEYLLDKLDKLDKGGVLPEGGKALPEAEPMPRRRSQSPRMIRTAKKAQREKPDEASDLAAEAAVAVELELESEAPGVDELFPELLEALADMNIPLGPEEENQDEKSVS